MEIEQNITQLEQIVNTKDKQLFQLQKELLKSKKANQTLKEEKNVLGENIKNHEKIIGELENDKREYEASKQIISLDCFNYKRETEIYDAFLKSNLAKSDYYVNTIKRLDAELRAKLDAINNLDKHNLTLLRENEASKDIEAFFQKKEDIYKSTLEKLFEDLNSASQAYQEKTAKLEYDLDFVQRENQRLRNNEQSLNDKINSLENLAKEGTEGKIKEIRGLEQALDLSLVQNKSRQAEAEKFRAEAQKKNSELEERDRKTFQVFEEKDKKIEALTQEVQNLHLKLIEKDEQITRFNEENQKMKVRETLLNQGLEEFESQEGSYNQMTKDDLLKYLKNIIETLKLERSEKTKAVTQLEDIKRDLAVKIPVLLDKQAEFHKTSEENDNLRSRNEKLIEELQKVYKEKVSYENQIKRIKSESTTDESFNAAFLNNQVSKLLVQNHKLKLALVNGLQNQSIEELLSDDVEKSNSIFYHDIDDLQKKHQLLVKRVRELKDKKERDIRSSVNPNKRLNRIEEEEEEDEEFSSGGVQEEPEFKEARKFAGKEIIEKKRKLEKENIQLQATQHAQDGVIKRLNEENLSLKNRIRELEQENIRLDQQISIMNVEKKNIDFQMKNQNVMMDSNLQKAEDNENQIRRLLAERENLNKRIVEKDKTINENLSKVEKTKKEILNLQHKLTLTEKELNNRKDFEERLNKAIEDSGRVNMIEEHDSVHSTLQLKEDNLLMKTKIENQTTIIKNYEERESNLQRLVNQATNQLQLYSEKLHTIFFQNDIKETYNSPTQEVATLRGKLYELQETLIFYKQELDNQTKEYQNAFGKIEEITNVISEKFGSLSHKFTEQGDQLKEQLASVTTDYQKKIENLNSKVDTYVESGAQEEVYEDNEWVHITEYQLLEEKLKKEEENTRSYKNMVDEIREQLLNEREENLKYTSVQSQETDQIKKYLIDINKLTSDKVRLENTIAKLNENVEHLNQQIAFTQQIFDKEIEALNEENKVLRTDIDKLTENIGKTTGETVEQAGILAIGQRNNLLNYLREKNANLALERDQLKAKLLNMRKKINSLQNEKLEQIGKLENELTSLKINQELETVPRTKFLKSIIEEKNNLLKENEKKEKLLKEQEKQISLFETLRGENIEIEESPNKMEEETNEDFDAEKILSLLERAKAQFEILGKIDMKDQKDQA